MAAFVSTGWDENLISQPAGSYIIQLNSANLPLPSREVRTRPTFIFTRPRVLTVMFQVMKLLLIPLPIYPLSNIPISSTRHFLEL